MVGWGDGSQASSQTIHWGLIGASQMARQVMIDAIRQPLVAQRGVLSTIVGIYSHNPRRAASFAAETYLPRSYAEITDLVGRAGVDCLYVSTHPKRQASLIARGLEAGKHLLCEPPMGLVAEEVAWLCQRAEERRLILGANFALRADPAMRRMVSLLQDYAIGDLISLSISDLRALPTSQQSWRLQPDGGGILLNRTIHLFDLLAWLFQDQVEIIQACEGSRILQHEAGFAGQKNQGVEEEVMLAGRLQRSRLPFQIYDSYLVPHASSTLHLYGTRGTLIAEHWGRADREATLRLVRAGQETEVSLAPGKPYHEVAQRFAQAVGAAQIGTKDATEDGTVPLATGWDALAALESVLIAKAMLAG